jgi:hypothetical protein
LRSTTGQCEGVWRDYCDQPGTKAKFLTEDRAAKARVMRAGASAFFIKPFDDQKFIAAVRDALNQA